MYRFGLFRFDSDTGYLRRGTDDVPLPPRAQALLGYLLAHPGRVISREAILDAVWGDVHVSDTSLKEAIHVLRVALGDSARSATYVETVPRRGYRFISPVRQEIESGARADPGTAASGTVAPDPVALLATTKGWGRWRLGVAVVGAVLAMGVLARFWVPPVTPAVPQRFSIQLPPEHGVTLGPPNLALSPDGRHLAYVAKAGGKRRLFLRPVSRLESSAIVGSEGARAPFFSPDGRWLGFFTAEGLHRVAVDGGDVETLCDLHNGLAASWGANSILISLLDSRDNTGLWSVPSLGGRPRVLTTRQEGEAAHRWPEVLPGGSAALFTVWRSGFDDAETVLLDLETGELSALFAGSNARYAAPGNLVFLRADQLWVVAFDVRRLKVTGEPVPVLSGVATTPVFGTAHFAVASTGSLVFMPRTEPPPPVLRRIANDGAMERLAVNVNGSVHDLRLAPDGRRMALTIMNDSGLDVWVMDLERGSLARRTFGGTSLGPVWSPDGGSLLIASRREGTSGIFRLSAAGTEEGDALWTGQAPGIATSWSHDGRHISISSLTSDQGWDLWTLEVDGELEPWLATRFNESRAMLSPNGRFLAYESEETGRNEVYLRPFADSGTQWTISIAGGSHPLWSKDGRQIWFRRGAEIYAADVQLEPSTEIGPPESRFQGGDIPGHNMAIGEAAIWVLEPQVSAEPTLTFIVNGLV